MAPPLFMVREEWEEGIVPLAPRVKPVMGCPRNWGLKGFMSLLCMTELTGLGHPGRGIEG